ncbi:MAG: cyclic nucleotide-binding domain-containing protein [Pirellulales bacterium]
MEPSKSDELLARVPAFRGLNAGERHQLQEIGREKTFEPGERVLVQGKTSQYLWFVLDGQCQVVRDSLHDGPVVLAELGPLQLFGEMSFFSPAPHSANVVAKTALRLLCIDRSDYDDLIRDNVPAAYKLAYNIVEGVAAKLRRMDERMAELSAEQDGQDDRHLEWRQFRERLFKGWSL